MNSINIIMQIIRAILGLTGFLFIVKQLKLLIFFLINIFYGPRRNLIKIYGKNSYVLITGGSEGIGEALA